MAHPGGRLRRRHRPARRALGRAAGGLRRALRRGGGDGRGAARRTPARTSPSGRRCRSTSRSLPELPKTAVGKVFKPDLRRRAIARVFDAALAAAGSAARVAAVVEDRRLGLVAELAAGPDGRDDAAARRRSAASPCPGAGGTRDAAPRLGRAQRDRLAGRPAVLQGYAIEERPAAAAAADAVRLARRRGLDRPARPDRGGGGAVEAALGLEVPTRDEMAEIEELEPRLHRRRRGG